SGRVARPAPGRPLRPYSPSVVGATLTPQPRRPRWVAARARYVWPALTVTVFLRRRSRTWTVPRLTLVNVPSQRSSTSQIVPRTVAELYLPPVRNLPLPLPHSLPRTDFGPFFLSKAAE